MARALGLLGLLDLAGVHLWTLSHGAALEGTDGSCRSLPILILKRLSCAPLGHIHTATHGSRIVGVGWGESVAGEPRFLLDWSVVLSEAGFHFHLCAVGIVIGGTGRKRQRLHILHILRRAHLGLGVVGDGSRLRGRSRGNRRCTVCWRLRFRFRIPWELGDL